MSNLGWYQGFSVFAKKVGGVANAIGIILGIGGIGGVAAKTAYDKIKSSKQTGTRYKVLRSGTDNQGLVFIKGDEFITYEQDGDCILIEKIGDRNNPYYVSVDFLQTISNFAKKKRPC